MKVVLATPNFHQPRGNTVTVQRMADGLEHLGIKTEIISITEDSRLTKLPSADLVHGFHAYRFYKFIEKLDHPVDSYIITITGTDLYQDLYHEEKRKDVLKCLMDALAIHVFDQKAKALIENELPLLTEKTYVIPQGKSIFPETDFLFEKENGSFLFVLPAGIRKVKNIPFAIHALQKLHNRYPHIRLWLVGPILEEEEGQLVSELVQGNSWISYLGTIPHAAMGTVYKKADVVLNTSHSEGQSSAILEAMGAGLPVLVSDNDGNKSIVDHRRTGLVYSGEIEFLAYAEQLVNNNEIGKELGQAALLYLDEHHNRESEALVLKEIYKKVLLQKRSDIHVRERNR